MAIKTVIKETKTEVECETIISYVCDICGKEVPKEKVVYYSTFDVEAHHAGNLEMCQPCSKVFEEEEDRLIERLKAERGQ